MSTVSTFLATVDGHVSSSSAVYETMRAGSTLAATTASSLMQVGQRFLTPTYSGWEAFVSFDTSSLPVLIDVSSAVFSVRGSSNNSTTDFTMELRSYNWSPTIQGGDWLAGDNVAANSTLRATCASTSYSTSYMDFADVALPAYISSTPTLDFIVVSDRFRIDTTPTDEEFLAVKTLEAGAGFEPKLVVTWDAVYSDAAEKLRIVQSPMRW